MAPQSASDITPMTTFCQEHLPTLLHEACGVDQALAQQIGEDVLVRAEAFAALDPASQDILTVPFVEEVFDYQPREASPRMKAAVAVVVRNSCLEEAHVSGPVNPGGIEAITTMAAGSLSQLIAAH